MGEKMDNKYNAYVYIFPLADETMFKIGKTNDPVKRIEKLLETHDISVKRSALYECSCDAEAFEIEKIMHTIYSHDRKAINGDGGTEFFKFSSFESAIQILDDIAVHRGFKKKNIYLSTDVKTDRIIDDKKVKSLLLMTGLAIKSRRLVMDMSQKELASICGLSRKTIITIEETGKASFENIVKVLNALEIEDVFSIPHGRLVEKKRASKNGYKIID